MPYFLTFELSRPVQLLLLGMARDRGKQIIEKIFLVVALAISSLEDKASKRSYAGCLFQLNILFAPVVLAFIIASSVISAPMLTTFTLPIFFLAYPRPLRFWPGSDGETASGDGVYYEQMVPPLIQALHKALRAGRLGLQQPGNILIARHEDRTVWIQIMEKGNGYVYYGAKGLELQETSCHSLEVTRIDDIFQDTFDREAGLNHFAFHTVTPLISIPVPMYASSRNVLTGVIESPDTLKLVAKLYSHCVIWYAFKTLAKVNSARSTNLSKDIIEVPDNNEPTAEDNDKKEETEDADGQTDEVANEQEQPAFSRKDTFLSIDNAVNMYSVLQPSSSIEAVNLDEWPSTETSPEQESNRMSAMTMTRASASTMKIQPSANPSRKSAYFKRRRSSEDSMPSILGSLSDLEDDGNTPQPLRRRGLLPPLKTEDLPGGVLEKTPAMPRRISNHNVVISRSQSPQPVNSLQSLLALPPLWLEVVRDPHKQFAPDLEADEADQPWSGDWIAVCLKKIMNENPDVVSEFREKDEAPEAVIKKVLRDLDFMTSLKEFVRGCLRIIYGSSDDLATLAPTLGPGLLVRAFSGKTQTSTMASAPLLLKKVGLPAYRAAVKAALDQILINGDTVVTSTDLNEALTDIDANWHLGQEDSESWTNAVRNSVQNLFTVTAFDAAGGRGGGRRYD